MSRKKIKVFHDNIQLACVHTVTKSKMVIVKTPEGPVQEQREVTEKEIVVRRWFRRDGLSSVEEYITTTNSIAKKRSLIFDRYTGRYYATWHTPDEILEKIYEPSRTANKIGYNK